MQIVKLESWNYDFYCPVTGRLLTEGDPGQLDIPTFRGLWVNNFFDEPTVSCEALEKAWRSRYLKFLEEDEEEEVWVEDVLESFLKAYEEPNWVGFELTTHGIACGPVCNTVWFVLDLGTLETN